LAAFLKKIEDQYGKTKRIWVMDRGIPTEETLAAMRNSDYPIHYLVGTPKGRLTKLEKDLVDLPWKEAREGVQVKLLDQGKEMYVFAESRDRVNKERSKRRRGLKRLWKRLKELGLQASGLKRDELMLKLGAARQLSPSAWRLVKIEVIGGSAKKVVKKFHFALRKDRLRQTRRREGRYLLRTNLCDHDPAQLWSFYMVLVQVEEAFKNLKGDLAIRPIFHQKEHRVEAHIFVAFVAYALHVTLRQHLKYSAPGLTPRAVLEKFRAIQMVDVHLPTTDGRTVVLSRHTQPQPEQEALLHQLRLTLPDQPPPQIGPTDKLHRHDRVVQT
jgi:transposase